MSSTDSKAKAKASKKAKAPKLAKAKPAEPAGPQEYRKPRADVFTMLLVVALLAIIIATVALWQVMAEYEYKIKGGPVVTWSQTVPAAEFVIRS